MTNWCYDFVLNNKYEHTASIPTAMISAPGRFQIVLEHPVVTLQGETCVDSRLPHLSCDAGKAMTLSSLMTGPVIVLTEQDRKAVVDGASVLSPVLRAKMKERVHILPPPVDYGLIDSRAEHYATHRKRRSDVGSVNVFHGGSLEGKRHLGDMVKAVSKVNTILPTSVKFVITTQKDSGGRSPYNDPVVEYRDRIGRDSFLNALKDGDILWCGSDYEGTGLAYMEAIRSGMIPIFIDAPWIRERIPADYPYVVKNLDNLAKVLMHVIKNMDEARVVAESLREYQGEDWSAANSARCFDRVMGPYTQAWREKNFDIIRGQFWVELLRNGLDRNSQPKSVSLADAHKFMAKESNKGEKLSFVKDYALRTAMLGLGYEDTCDSIVPTFERVN